MEIEVNSKKIQARKGDTILEALTRNGIKVPTLCNIKGLSPTGACRVCVVEVEGIDTLVTSCSFPATEGMKVKTHSPKVLKARKLIIELLLSSHPDDCLYCERNGNCELQHLAIELNIRERRVIGPKNKHKLDQSSPSIVRDPSKCILCGRCVRVCDEIQCVDTFEYLYRGKKTMVGTAMNHDLNSSNCIACGQCIIACPTGALTERSNIADIKDLLSSKEKKIAVQIGPGVSVSIAEEFNLKAGKDQNGILFALLRAIGIDFVFDTAFAADLNIIETANELNMRIENNDNLPLLSSCCPAWVKFVEQFYPELIPLLSVSKSPQQMMGSIIKSHFAASQGITPSQIYSVAIMPCVAKKLEAHRPEMSRRGISDVDAVLTTRELINLIKLFGIDVHSLKPQQPDLPFGVRSTSGKLFANSGGATEGIIRTLYFIKTGKELPLTKIGDLRSTNNTKIFTQKMGKHQVNTIVSSGLTNIRKLITSIKNNETNAHFIEVMACPGGCINGGGQPLQVNKKNIKNRAKGIYEIDETESLRCAHNNPLIQELYKTLLDKPNSEKAKQLLHVSYLKKETLT